MSSQQTEEKALPEFVHVSFDQLKLKAFLKIDTDGTDEIGPALLPEIMNGLEAMGIKDIDEDAVADLLENTEPDKSAVIASGIPPKCGKDGQIQYHFDTSRERTAAYDKDSDRVDHRELNLIQNVNEGDTLATATLPEPGVPGRNVLDEEIPAPAGKPAKIKVGRGVRLEDDGLKAVTAQDGMVTFEGEKIEVLPIYKVNGDINYLTGNVLFRGDVIIGRDVKEDFKVEATGNVQVFGDVDKGDVKAGGSVEVNGGILGKETVFVRAGGDITMGFADNANLVAGGCILVRGEMLWSSVQAKKVILEGMKRAVIGGTVMAFDEIKITNAGNPESTTKTVLEIRFDPRIIEQLQQFNAELKNVKQDAKKANETYSRFCKLKERQSGTLSEKAESALCESRDKIHAAKEKETQLSSEIEKLEAELHDAKKAKIIISGKTFPGTRITIHGATLKMDDTVTGVTFRNEGGRIVARC
ncbi:MAG: DUF342 domain-containing protein [Candidatus Hydrogenedentes bacterium]|nr:DUF342 domain-containing protein [Candidatus Hydrogenedentota bacterium]